VERRKTEKKVMARRKMKKGNGTKKKRRKVVERRNMKKGNGTRKNEER
jgi:hypothetical protein